MKIALISPSPPDLYAPGLRTISSYLKKNGHEVRLILLAGGTEKLNFGGQFIYQFQEHIIDQIIELSRDVDLIGLSFMTQYFDRAVQLTRKIKESTSIPVIWGGIHSTLCPEECIEHADIICIGEGELALLELMNKMQNGQDYYDTKSFWFKRDGEIVRNEVRPLLEDLDELPFQDYDFEDQYVYDLIKDRIVPLTEDMFEGLFSLAPDLSGRMVSSYKIMTTRGCPMNCSFCASSFLKKKLYTHKYVRHRSVEHVMAELKEVIKRFPSIKLIQLFDDILFYMNKDFIKELARAYKENIGLPFYCQASATTMDEEKLKYLLDAGLIWVEIGIQSGSERTNKIYKRNVSNEQLLNSASILHKYSAKLLPSCYHVILDNPWETSEDILKTLNLILELPRPYSLKLASLVFFPKTGIYDKAKAEGLIKNDLEEIYRKPFVYVSGSYLNYLVYLAGYTYFPRWILKLLANSVMVKIFYREKFSSIFSRLYNFTETLRKIGRGVQALFRGEFKRIFSGIKLRLRTNGKV